MTVELRCESSDERKMLLDSLWRNKEKTCLLFSKYDLMHNTIASLNLFKLNFFFNASRTKARKFVNEE